MTSRNALQLIVLLPSLSKISHMRNYAITRFALFRLINSRLGLLEARMCGCPYRHETEFIQK